MPAITYPDVPRSPGVPPVLREIGAIEATAILLVADAVIVASLVASYFLAPQWGIFTQAGVPIAAADSVKGLDYRREYELSHYPVEAGAFGTYNKVQRPFESRVEFTIGDSFLPNLPGSQVQRRGVFLVALEAAAASVALYTVVTPEFRYPSANVKGLDYRRSAQNGATLMTVSVGVEEVRVIGTAQFAQSQAQQPAGQADVYAGQVQAAPLVPVTQEALPPLSTSGSSLGTTIDGLRAAPASPVTALPAAF